MFKKIICLLKGHDLEKDFCRSLVYQYYHRDKHFPHNYYSDKTFSDENQEEW